MDTERLIELELDKLEEQIRLAEASYYAKDENIPSEIDFKKLYIQLTRLRKSTNISMLDLKNSTSSLRDLNKKYDLLRKELEYKVADLLKGREREIDAREKLLEERETGPSVGHMQAKRRLDNSDDLLVKYVDGSIKPAQKEYVEYWISNSETIKNRLDEVSKVINSLNQMVTKIHDAPIPDKSTEVLNQIEEKLSKRTVETPLEKNERGMLNLLIRKWLEPGLLGAAVAAAGMWFFVMPANVNLGDTQSLGLTKILNSPYIDGTGDSFPVVRFRSAEGVLETDPLSSALGKILEQRKSNASLVDSGKEYKVVLKGAFISENNQHCDSGQLLSDNKFTFFVGCRTAENNWQIDFLSK